MKKFNIAFIPKNNTKQFISLIEKEKKYSNSYCIGIKSIPHVTICQFYFDPENVDSVWDKICNNLEDTSIYLSFRRYSNISFDNKLYWLSLLPEEYKDLNEIFRKVTRYLTSIRKDAYNPH